MAINTTWTAPSSLDLAAGDTLTETIWDQLVSDLNFIGGANGSYSCRAYHDANQSINNATLTALSFNQERYDTDTMHSTSSNTSRITFTTAGKYHVEGNISYDANATGERFAGIRLGGTTYIARVHTPNNGAGSPTDVQVSAEYAFSAAEYVELIAYQVSTAALNVLTSANYSPEFMAHKIG